MSKNQPKGRYGVKFVTSYKTYWAQLDPRSIYNWVGPTSIDYFEVPDFQKPKRHLNFEASGETEFYKNLEESIRKEGFRNPILVNSGKIDPIMTKALPLKIQHTSLPFLICDFLGGSRLYIAQKNHYTIPCIVSDWSGNFEGERLFGPDDIQDKFSGEVKVWFDHWGVRTTVPQ